MNQLDFYLQKKKHKTVRQSKAIDFTFSLFAFRILNIYLRRGFVSTFFRPKTRPKTFMQCFALAQRESKGKHCRNVLGHVLGQIN